MLVRRGMEGNSLTTPAMMRPDLTIDYEAAVKWINKKYNNPSLYAMGLSMGANRLTKYAGLSGKKCLFKAIAVLAVAYDTEFAEFGIALPGNNLIN